MRDFSSASMRKFGSTGQAEKENDSEGPLFREGKRLLNYMLLSSACEYEGQEWNSSLSFTKERVDNMAYLSYQKEMTTTRKI